MDFLIIAKFWASLLFLPHPLYFFHSIIHVPCSIPINPCAEPLVQYVAFHPSSRHHLPHHNHPLWPPHQAMPSPPTYPAVVRKRQGRPGTPASHRGYSADAQCHRLLQLLMMRTETKNYHAATLDEEISLPDSQ